MYTKMKIRKAYKTNTTTVMSLITIKIIITEF